MDNLLMLIFALPLLIPLVIAGFLIVVTVAVIAKGVKSMCERTVYYHQSKTNPKVIIHEMSEAEINKCFRENDNAKNGYNPFRQDYALLELFPVLPDLEIVKAEQVKMFGKEVHEVKVVKEKMAVYKESQRTFTAMLIMKERMIELGQWNSEREEQWIKFPYRPKQFLKMDRIYYDTQAKPVIEKIIKTEAPKVYDVPVPKSVLFN